jgi:hypothetical protein
LKDLPFFSCIFGNFVLSLYPDKITIKNYMTMAIKKTYEIYVDAMGYCNTFEVEATSLTDAKKKAIKMAMSEIRSTMKAVKVKY